jgi:hypothetical protein
MFIITIAFIFITANIQSYKNDIYITDRQVEQIIIESLFQSGRESVKNELNTPDLPNNVYYTFPDGNVHITITSHENLYELNFTIHTNNNTDYSFKNYMLKDEEPP